MKTRSELGAIAGRLVVKLYREKHEYLGSNMEDVTEILENHYGASIEELKEVY